MVATDRLFVQATRPGVRLDQAGTIRRYLGNFSGVVVVSSQTGQDVPLQVRYWLAQCLRALLEGIKN